MKIDKGIDKKIIAKAEGLLRTLEAGGNVGVKFLRARGYRSIKVNIKYRLLEKGDVWYLISHSKYNKFCER